MRKLKTYVSFTSCFSEVTAKVCSYKTMTKKDVLHYLHEDGSFKSPKREISIDPSLTAIRLKKMRLRKTAVTIASKHGDRTRFCTITFRFSEELKNKKYIQEKLKYLFKKMKRAGYEIEYSGMLERHLGEKRKDKTGSMAWHFHCLAYRVGGELWRGVPAWDYDVMQDIAVSLDGNIDMKPLKRSEDSDKKISEYMAKLDVACIAAYETKKVTGEDYCYTMTSKGCDRPRQRRYSGRRAHEFMKLGGFIRNSNAFPSYLSKDKKFAKKIYDDDFNQENEYEK